MSFSPKSGEPDADDKGKSPKHGKGGKGKKPPKPNPALAGLQSAIQSKLMQGQSDPNLAMASATAPPPSAMGPAAPPSAPPSAAGPAPVRVKSPRPNPFQKK